MLMLTKIVPKGTLKKKIRQLWMEKWKWIKKNLVSKAEILNRKKIVIFLINISLKIFLLKGNHLFFLLFFIEKNYFEFMKTFNVKNENAFYYN